MKKAVSVLLSLLLVLSCVSAAGAADVAEDGSSGSFSVLCYNVAGLPDFSAVTGEEPRTPEINQTFIGKYVVDNGYDIFCTQEDFGFHDVLAKSLTGYKYATVHHGSIPYGDGTNIFTKDMPVYNEKHKVWRSLYGIMDDGADVFSQKGVTYVTVEIAEGVYVDLYNIHTDAYGDAGSNAARADNFVQLAEMINSRETDRAVIVTGDFNEYLLSPGSTSMQTMVEGLGLKDAWVELYNDGVYDSESPYIDNYCDGVYPGPKWGVWDSVERFMYRDGGGVSLTCDSFDYLSILNGEGKECSDHMAAGAVFSFTVDAQAAAEAGAGELDAKGKPSWVEYVRKFVMFIRAIWIAVSNFDTIKEFLGI